MEEREGERPIERVREEGRGGGGKRKDRGKEEEG